MLTRLRAARHEITCAECRVTWGSWVERLVGMERGYTPLLPSHIQTLVDDRNLYREALEQYETPEEIAARLTASAPPRSDGDPGKR